MAVCPTQATDPAGPLLPVFGFAAYQQVRETRSRGRLQGLRLNTICL